MRLTAYADPLDCDPSIETRPADDTGGVHVIVAGGAWVPTGIELDGEVVGLARGSGRVVVRVDCSRESGRHELLVNVHDLGPETPTSIVETNIEMYFLPPPPEDGGLQLGIPWMAYSDPPSFHPTAYCEPGGMALIPWTLVNYGAFERIGSVGYRAIEKPTTVLIDGEHAWSRADRSQISVDYGDRWVECPEELGLHTLVIEATDSSTPPQSARFEYLLRVVESHPSEVEW